MPVCYMIPLKEIIIVCVERHVSVDVCVAFFGLVFCRVL